MGLPFLYLLCLSVTQGVLLAFSGGDDSDGGSVMEILNPLNAVHMVREATKVVKNEAFLQLTRSEVDAVIPEKYRTTQPLRSSPRVPISSTSQDAGTDSCSAANRATSTASDTGLASTNSDATNGISLTQAIAQMEEGVVEENGDQVEDDEEQDAGMFDWTMSVSTL